MLFPALSCIAVGGILLLMTNMQVGNLFAAHRSTIITLYNGAFDSSSAVFLIIKVSCHCPRFGYILYFVEIKPAKPNLVKVETMTKTVFKNTAGHGFDFIQTQCRLHIFWTPKKENLFSVKLFYFATPNWVKKCLKRK
ncbi:hypothetical protein ILYODFUR_037050 [Ilyodon furcidens]|uniref:Uncharacterized protein n=1 Tax=Ilyodon furcidens TaxID=33524 RepID=A0ABV0SUV4_9TELE